MAEPPKDAAPPESHRELELPEQIANRRAARARIAALGRAIYPNRWDPTHLVSDVVAKWSSLDAAALDATPEADRLVRVPGRILAIRKMGKAIFLDLSDGVRRVQAYLKKDALRPGDWELLEQLDLGDHVGVAGSVFRTRTGELSVRARSLDFLSKSLRPLPDKWHGLTDVERKYRQRYVDLVVSPETRRTFEIRAKIVGFIRRFFDARGFVEVETPMMQTLAGRRGRAPVRDASPRARPRPLPAHRPGAVPEAPRRGRLPEGLRDQPQLPQRGHLHPPQPRVHDARVLHGVRRRARPDGAHGGAPHERRAGDPRDDRARVGRRDDLAESAVQADLDGRRDSGEHSGGEEREREKEKISANGPEQDARAGRATDGRRPLAIFTF